MLNRADAEIVREFDVNTKAFVPEADKPFVLPEAKSSVCWKDRNTLIVGGAFFGEGSMRSRGLSSGIRGRGLSSARSGGNSPVNSSMKTPLEHGPSSSAKPKGGLQPEVVASDAL